MITIEIPEKKRLLYLPENLSECDERQYADMAKLFYMLSRKEISYPEFRTLAVYSLLDLKAGGESDTKYENIFRLSEYIDNFFEKYTENDEEKIRVKYNYIHNHFPSLSLFGTYIGPEDGFQNVCFGQYTDGLEEYIYYTQSGDIQSLRTLFAIFYLPKGEKYSLEMAKKRAKGLFRSVDIRHLYGFFLYFTSMQEYILSGQLMVMGNEIDLNIIYQETEDNKKPKSNIPGLGWVASAYDIAESGVFGNYEGVRATNMWSVLLRLYQLKKQRLDEIEQEKMNKK